MINSMKFTSNVTRLNRNQPDNVNKVKKETNAGNLDLKRFNNFHHLVADWTAFDSTERPMNLY